MTEDSFLAYNIEDLSKEEGVEVVNCNGVAVLHCCLSHTAAGTIFTHPCRVRNTIAILCVQGEMHISSYLNEYTLHRASLFMASATMLQLVSCSDGCEIYMMTVNEKFLSDCNIDFRLILPVFNHIHNNPLLTISQNRVVKIINSFKNFHLAYLSSEPTPFHDAVVRHLFAALLYRLCEEAARAIAVAPMPEIHTRNREYFHKLMALLAENFRTERSVQFYASKMNLTPKHLSRLIHNLTGRTVREWIDEIVILEIKNLLRYSDLSIQQISFEMNFANPSFMGQYFKRMTGITPGEYRRNDVFK